MITFQNVRWRLARGRDRPGRARFIPPASSSGRCSASACRTTIRLWPKHALPVPQQQDFGGWFQTTTHENFRTPMRETRYAVMALAEAFPRPEAPRRGWGNRDDGPARLPRTDSLVHTLDDLENLWDVPKRERPGFERAIVPLLEHPEPMVRLNGGGRPGSAGEAESVTSLVERLADASKIVWRAAAWALRRLGNQGIGHRCDPSALKIPIPAFAAGPLGSSPTSSTGWTNTSTWPTADRAQPRSRSWTRLQAIETFASGSIARRTRPCPPDRRDVPGEDGRGRDPRRAART